MVFDTSTTEQWGASKANDIALARTPWHIRPYLDSDSDNLCDYFNALTSTSLRERFQYSMDTVQPSMLTRYSRKAFPSNFALVAFGGEESSTICGEALLACNPRTSESEFAISVGDQFQRKGLGSALIKRLIKISVEMGMLQVYADTLRSNHGFIALADSMGCSRQSHPDDWRQARFVLHPGLNAHTSH